MIDQIIFTPDFLMDLAMLVVVQLSFGSLQLKRLLIASCTLTLCTRLMLILNPPQFFATCLHPIIFLLSARLVLGAQRPQKILEAALCMFCAGAVLAGVLTLGSGVKPVCAAAGAALFAFLLRGRRHESYRWNIEVYIEKDGLNASFPALIDTGNRLREHRSGHPVLIVEARVISDLAKHIDSLPPDQTQTLPFGVLGAIGEIRCFQPDLVRIQLPARKPFPAPACWIAVFPGKIPGKTCALAPPSFATAIETKHIKFKRHFTE